MANMVGMSATNAHIYLMLEGYHLLESKMNSNVIFNVYGKGGASVALLINKDNHNVAEVV